ncbi:MAG: hypothetical protein ABH842_01990 [Candidatus Micrarchaeota archaeon]
MGKIYYLDRYRPEPKNERNATKPRWGRFKDIVYNYPQTLASTTTFVVAMEEVIRRPDSKVGLAVGVLGGFCTLGALTRETLNKNVGRIEKIISGAIGLVSLGIGTGLVITGDISNGMNLSLLGAFIATAYKPILHGISGLGK